MSKQSQRKLHVLCAGSLNAAFSEISDEFRRLYPNVKLIQEMGGSASLVREVIQGRECGVLASADYSLIRHLMLPDYAGWYIVFASNQMVLRYTDSSKYQEEINGDNWYEILQRDGVTIWHSDPDGDPGGYRALMVLQLAEKYYKVPRLYDRLMSPEHDRVITRANFQESNTGYSFGYGLNAGRGGSRVLALPDEINLSTEAFADYYKQAVVTISGKNPGEAIALYGAPILFGVTIPESYGNPELAIKWLHLLLSSKGRNFLKKSGMIPLKPVTTDNPEKIPDQLRKYIK
jgi:molybdate/tungstate transport system substrate-binding protein